MQEMTRPWLLTIVLFVGTVILSADNTAATEVLDVFAGQDKLVRVNVDTIFNEGALVRPNPPSPDRSYQFEWDFDISRDLNLDSVYDNDKESEDLLTSRRFTAPGQFVCTLTVTNDLGDTAKDTCVVTAVVDELPTAQIVSVSPNQTTEGKNVVFVGEGTDPDGTVVGYEWESNRDGVLSGDVTFNTTSISVGVHTIEFRALDDKGFWSEPVTVTVEVERRINKPPTLVVLTNRTKASTDTVIEFVVRYIDAEGDMPTVFHLYYRRDKEYLCETLLESDAADGDCTDGKDYYFKAKLREPGNYSYYFEFLDPDRVIRRTNERSIDVKELEGFIPGWGSFTMVAAMSTAAIASTSAVARRRRSECEGPDALNNEGH